MTHYRQIIAYKNLIEALEHISIAMILALGFFINGTLNHIDYREFIRTNSLSQEHLLSAKHFLQRDSIFTDDIESQLTQWYSEFTNHVMNTVHQGNYFENRHDFVYDPLNNNSREADAAYLDFMKIVVLPRILEFQEIIRKDIRSNLSQIFLE
jgi:hypothetical protein